MSYTDLTLTCRDCGNTFIFTAGEQEFYAQKGFLHEPVRCPECRKSRKREMTRDNNRANRPRKDAKKKELPT